MGGVGVSVFRISRRGLLAALALLSPVLGGCSSPALPSMPSMSSWFGSSNAAGDANASSPVANALPPNFECPPVTVRAGASTLTSAVEQAEPSAMNLRYQVGISTTARECRVVGGTVSIRVGIQGRVILGPQGNPGTVDVPIRYAVIREAVTPTTIVTRLERVAVNVAPGDTNVLFSHVVESLEFPMPRGADIDAYVVYIGFDPAAAQERKPAPRPARPRKQIQG